jgi:hypothetical protein
MNPKIVPCGLTIKEMNKEAEECEQKARVEVEPTAGTLREKALVLREWIAALKTGGWTS